MQAKSFTCTWRAPNFHYYLEGKLRKNSSFLLHFPFYIAYLFSKGLIRMCTSIIDYGKKGFL